VQESFYLDVQALVQCSTLQCEYNSVQHEYNTVQHEYNAVQYSIVQYSTIYM
jgi:hypothetical protein